MTYSNGVRDDTQQLRDIQDLIAKLKDVNKKLAQPMQAMSTARTADTDRPTPLAEPLPAPGGRRLAVVQPCDGPDQVRRP